MAEESWHAARLIPTSGINGAEEQERRATSALLAVMSSVREFGKAITKPLGAPNGAIDTFIEVPFALGEAKHRPDGLIRIRKGQTIWTALVEVKTGTNRLQAAQLEVYLDIARDQGFDALLTISNEIAPMAGVHPTVVDRRKTRKIPLHHLSWTQVLTEAVMQKTHRGVSDPDQAWILGELIRYLEEPRSGAMEFEDMGQSWVSVRDATTHGTLRPYDKAAAEVSSRWDQLVRYACLRFGRSLGIEVQPLLSKRELADPSSRTQAVVASLCRDGSMTGALRIPGTAGPISLCADLRAGRVSAWLEVEAPQTGKPTTRVNWLVRQLKDAPATARVDAFTVHGRGLSGSALLGKLREDPTALVDVKRELRAFRVVVSAPMGTKRGQGRGSFVGSVLDLLDAFYASTVQNVKPWSATPPKFRPPPPPDPTVSEQLGSTALSSQDGPTTEDRRRPVTDPEPSAAAMTATTADKEPPTSPG